MSKRDEIVNNIVKELKSASKANVKSFIEDISRNLSAYNEAGYFQDKMSVKATIVNLATVRPLERGKKQITNIAAYRKELEELYKDRTFLELNALSIAIEGRVLILRGEKLPSALIASKEPVSTDKEGNFSISTSKLSIYSKPVPPPKGYVASAVGGVASVVKGTGSVVASAVKGTGSAVATFVGWTK